MKTLSLCALALLAASFVGCSAAAPQRPLTFIDAGVVAPIQGQVGPQGGTVSRLYFAVVGDTRPSFPDDTAGYPFAIIQKIFSDIDQMQPRPEFTVATGDYMNADAFGLHGFLQMDLYMKAAVGYHGTLFATMGNHECNSIPSVNCAQLDTNNFRAFRNALVTPLGQSRPYYSVPLSAPDQSWTAKLVVVACNAWDDTQSTWLEQTLARPTTYTFVTRHEPRTTTGPCVQGSDAVLARHPLDLLLVGHIHEFSHDGNQVTVGIGGADLSGPGPFGYATVEQLQGHAFRVVQYDYATALPISGFDISEGNLR